MPLKNVNMYKKFVGFDWLSLFYKSTVVNIQSTLNKFKKEIRKNKLLFHIMLLQNLYLIYNVSIFRVFNGLFRTITYTFTFLKGSIKRGCLYDNVSSWLASIKEISVLN